MEEIMDIQEMWNRFERTGNIEDYLDYRTGMTWKNEQDSAGFGNKSGETYGCRADRSDRNGTGRFTY